MKVKNVLIVGELSGISRNLSAGFNALGIKNKTISYGNGARWRSGYDLNGPSVLGHYPFKNIIPFIFLPRLLFFDLVVIVDKSTFNIKFGINRFLIYLIIKLSKVSIYWVAACDSFSPKALQKITHNKKVCEGCLNDSNLKSCDLLNSNQIKDHQMILKNISYIAPAADDYTSVYKLEYIDNKLINKINFALDVSKIPFSEDFSSERKVSFYHGITRPGFKGSESILKALKILKQKYPLDVSVVSKNFIKPEDYIYELSKHDVLVDQLYGAGMGMNTLLGLSLGRIVISGITKSNISKNMGDNSSPVFHFEDDSVDKIFEVLENVFLLRKKFSIISKNGRKFVEKNHDPKIIAQHFLRLKGYKYD